MARINREHGEAAWELVECLVHRALPVLKIGIGETDDGRAYGHDVAAVLAVDTRDGESIFLDSIKQRHGGVGLRTSVIAAQ